MPQQPAPWLVEHERHLPPRGAALDVACGRGRNTLWLAAKGFEVDAIDRDPVAVRAVNDEADARALQARARVLDLENGDVSLGRSRYDVIVVFHYLHRALCPALIDALRPGGVLIYETFTRAQALRGKPTNPAFLLNDGELVQLFQRLEVLDCREGEVDGRCVASLVARKRDASDSD